MVSKELNQKSENARYIRKMKEKGKGKEKKRYAKKGRNKTSFVKLLFIRVQIASTYSFSLSKFAHSGVLKWVGSKKKKGEKKEKRKPIAILFPAESRI